MTIQEIKTKYTPEQLFQGFADADLRRKVLSTLFDNLYENKIIYREKVALIAEVESFEFSEEFFSVELKLLQHICGDSIRDQMFAASFKANKTVKVKSRWETMGFKGNSLCSTGYNCWFMLFDAELVENVDKLLFDSESVAASDFVHNEIWPADNSNPIGNNSRFVSTSLNS